MQGPEKQENGWNAQREKCSVMGQTKDPIKSLMSQTKKRPAKYSKKSI